MESIYQGIFRLKMLGMMRCVRVCGGGVVKFLLFFTLLRANEIPNIVTINACSQKNILYINSTPYMNSVMPPGPEVGFINKLALVGVWDINNDKSYRCLRVINELNDKCTVYPYLILRNSIMVWKIGDGVGYLINGSISKFVGLA